MVSSAQKGQKNNRSNMKSSARSVRVRKPLSAAAGKKETKRLMRTLQQEKPYLSEQYKVKSLGIFGSYLRGQQKRRSDLDLLVEFGETPNLFEFMELEDYLSDLLGVKVDLVTRPALRGNIGQRILGEVVPI